MIVQFELEHEMIAKRALAGSRYALAQHDGCQGRPNIANVYIIMWIF